MSAFSLRTFALLAVFLSSNLFAEPYPGRRISPKPPKAPVAQKPSPDSAKEDAETDAAPRKSGSSNVYLGIEAGPSTPSESGFKDDSYFRLTLGSQSSDNVAFEFSYVTLGEFAANDELKQDLSFLAGSTVTGASVSVSGFELALQGTLPVTDRFGVLGRAGFFLWNTDADVKGPSFGTVSSSDSGSDLLIGVGAQYKVGKAAVLEAVYNRTSASDGDVTTLGAGINLKL